MFVDDPTAHKNSGLGNQKSSQCSFVFEFGETPSHPKSTGLGDESNVAKRYVHVRMGLERNHGTLDGMPIEVNIIGV